MAPCGKSVAGSHVHSLVLTDVALGWTEAAAMVVRKQALVKETVQAIRARLPFPMLGLDVDNDSTLLRSHACLLPGPPARTHSLTRL